MVSSSLARRSAKAVGEAVGAGGWSYEQIVSRLSPAVSKFSVSIGKGAEHSDNHVGSGQQGPAVGKRAAAWCCTPPSHML